MKRKSGGLGPSLEHGLNSYALAASAAGVSLLALAPPAEAKIVYTPTHISIVNHSKLDLNHDHKADFIFGTQSSTLDGTTGSFRLSVQPVGTKNRIWGMSRYASALAAGVRVGPNRKKLQTGHYVMGRWVWHCCRPLSTTTWGQWPKVQKGYLGLKFYVKGEAHYGWTRLSIRKGVYIKTTLTGYAYETIPNKSIIAGKTHGKDVVTLPATLGRLAQGASGLSAWRGTNSPAAAR